MASIAPCTICARRTCLLGGDRERKSPARWHVSAPPDVRQAELVPKVVITVIRMHVRGLHDGRHDLVHVVFPRSVDHSLAHGSEGGVNDSAVMVILRKGNGFGPLGGVVHTSVIADIGIWLRRLRNNCCAVVIVLDALRVRRLKGHRLEHAACRVHGFLARPLTCRLPPIAAEVNVALEGGGLRVGPVRELGRLPVVDGELPPGGGLEG
eukprot:scaffold45584_cov40-Tisochrysis_lutea.AAC.1